MDKTPAEQLRSNVQAFVDTHTENVLKMPHWAQGLSDRQWGLIEDCRRYTKHNGHGLPGHQLILLVSMLAGRLEDADITPTEKEAGEVARWLLATFGNIVDGDTLMEQVESVLTHYINQMGRWVKLSERWRLKR